MSYTDVLEKCSGSASFESCFKRTADLSVHLWRTHDSKEPSYKPCACRWISRTHLLRGGLSAEKESALTALKLCCLRNCRDVSQQGKK
jgi:hypothetical protein